MGKRSRLESMDISELLEREQELCDQMEYYAELEDDCFEAMDKYYLKQRKLKKVHKQIVKECERIIEFFKED